MYVQFWGVRGSIASPMRTEEYHGKIEEILQLARDNDISTADSTKKFIASLPDRLQHVTGGNTTCASVLCKSQNICIIDAGSGIRVLGDQMMKGPAGEGKAEVHLFFTHTHWDHICGLPFFKPIYIPGNKIHIYSPLDDIYERLVYQQEDRFFPKTFDDLGSEKIFHKLDNKSPLTLEGDLEISFQKLRHPSGCYAYKFKQAGKVFIFATDVELTGADLESPEEEHKFFDNADVLVIDAQYTLDESFQKFDWGHTSITMAVNCALNWNVKKLILTHHEPAYNDHTLSENLFMAIEHAQILERPDLEIELAREGLSFTI